MKRLMMGVNVKALLILLAIKAVLVLVIHIRVSDVLIIGDK
jgi:hypothetical protein